MKEDIIQHWKGKKSEDFENQSSFLRIFQSNRDPLVDEKSSYFHHQVFNELDCLDCANCCKSTPAILLSKDIKRIAKFLKISPSYFRRKYVLEDLNGELSFRKVPCVFLQENMHCQVYEVRPDSCRDYPHTEAPAFFSRSHLHIKNHKICPAVFEIVERLKGSLH